MLDKGRLLLKDNVDNVISEYISLNKNRSSILNKVEKGDTLNPVELIDSKIISIDYNKKEIFPVTEKLELPFSSTLIQFKIIYI